MQISKISSSMRVSSPKLQANSADLMKNGYTNYSSYNPEKMFSMYLGRDLLSFKSRNFADTLAENYFQLPEGCTPDEFQIEAGKALNEGKDVLVEAPTGTGKTAIAHYATTKNMIEGKTTFYTTPLKALSNQKLNEFRKVYGDENVGILTGDRRENVDAPVIVMTTEVYRNMALTNMYGGKTPIMDNLGTVIFDEFHYLGDEERGPVWEESLMYTPKGVQTLELSATIGNPQELNGWMNNIDGDNSKLVSIPPSARNVPLNFDTMQTGSYKAEEKKLEKKLKRSGFVNMDAETGFSPKPTLSDFKFAVNKLNKKEQLPAIFFVFSRNFSRELLEYFGNEGDDLTTPEEKKQIEKIVEEYKEKKYIGSDIDFDALKKGYAIHNAGIMPQQKELIEELFQKKLLKTVIATETLAAGINMPAKTVVISSPYKPSNEVENENGTRLLSANEFKQMAGRAGRRGIDTIGYVYTMPTDRKTETDFLNLEAVDSNPILSKYDPDYAFLAGFYQYNPDSSYLENIYNKSFYTYSKDAEEKSAKMNNLMDLSNKRTKVMLTRGYLEEKDGIIKPTLKGEMASCVRGYDALTLVDTIANKKFEGITPAALAMVAGTLANEVLPHENLIYLDTDLSFIFNNSLESIDLVHYNLRRSVHAMLEKYGKRMMDFSNYDEMLVFAESIEKPEGTPAEYKEKLDAIAEKRQKYVTIACGVKNMKPNQVVEALQNGEALPTKTLEDCLEYVESYKKHISAKNPKSHISKLEDEIENLRKNNKGNKAKDKAEKEIAQLEEQLQYAKTMEFLDEHLVDAIGDNYRFVKENSLKSIDAEYKQAEEMYASMTSKDKLIESIKGLKSVEEYKATNNVAEDRMRDNAKVSKLILDCTNVAMSVCQDEYDNGIEKAPQDYGQNGAAILYNWALLNEINTDSMTNWEELLRTMPNKEIDEGTMYRTVMQTADLLSQIGEIAAIGEKGSTTDEDKEYYSQLRDTAAYTRSLLIKDPVVI